MPGAPRANGSAWAASTSATTCSGRDACRRTASRPDDLTDAIREHNALIAADERFVSSILPIRDGVMVALRIS